MSVISNHIVLPGEQIADIVLNETGSPNNWDAFLTANDFTTWTPTLTPGQSLIVAFDSKQENIQRELAIYPSCNFAAVPDLNEQLNELISNFAERQYIFSNGNPYIFSDSQPYIFN
jgi:hypothetical protein